MEVLLLAFSCVAILVIGYRAQKTGSGRRRRPITAPGGGRVAAALKLGHQAQWQGRPPVSAVS